MLWSISNVMHESPRHGPLTYNAFSNALLDLDDARHRRLAKVRERGGAEVPPAPPVGEPPQRDEDFFVVLLGHGMLVDDGVDEADLLTFGNDRLF